MNVIAKRLQVLYPEVEPMEFYREIFPDGELDQLNAMTKGKYTGIAIEISDKKRTNGKLLINRYTVTDDLDVIDQLISSPYFCVLAPISYVGKCRKSVNARIMYALVIELDNLLVKDGEQIGLNTLIRQWSDKVHWIPKPTFLVASGNGVHLYYVFERGIPLFQNVVESLEKYKRAMTKMVWNEHVTRTYTDETIQQESIFQAFRMVGTVTKNGDKVRAYRTGDRVTIEYLNKYLLSQDQGCSISEVYKSTLTKKEAQKKYPEWFEKRVVEHKPKGHWICKRDLYDWWKRRITAEAVVGHRYYCLMMLSIYAIKCDISRAELEHDCFELMEVFEERTDRADNHFTEKDVLDALQSFEDAGLITYPIASISNRSGLHIEKNKRNYRSQDIHLKIARATQDILDPEGNWRNKNGRPIKKNLVKEWQRSHPDGTIKECMQQLGVARNTVKKYWRK